MDSVAYSLIWYGRELVSPAAVRVELARPTSVTGSPGSSCQL
ncbi:hypothetical protein OG981_02895 [Streptomyces mirabilis]